MSMTTPTHAAWLGGSTPFHHRSGLIRRRHRRRSPSMTVPIEKTTSCRFPSSALLWLLLLLLLLQEVGLFPIFIVGGNLKGKIHKHTSGEKERKRERGHWFFETIHPHQCAAKQAGRLVLFWVLRFPIFHALPSSFSVALCS